eukprot:241397-Pelagomonas_calceolata.AAC.1
MPEHLEEPAQAKRAPPKVKLAHFHPLDESARSQTSQAETKSKENRRKVRLHAPGIIKLLHLWAYAERKGLTVNISNSEAFGQ